MFKTHIMGSFTRDEFPESVIAVCFFWFVAQDSTVEDEWNALLIFLFVKLYSQAYVNDFLQIYLLQF